MRKIIRLTESDLARIVRRVIEEQDTDWKYLADQLEKAMKGLGTDEDTITQIIYNNVSNESEWNSLKNAFGKRNGETLEEWLKDDLSSSEYDQLMQFINDEIAQGKKEDSMYNPGSKINRITNRQFIIGRAYQYANTMGDKEENILDMDNATVVRRENDGFVVKVPLIDYNPQIERKRYDYTQKNKTISNVCIKIKFSDIIEWRDDTLQLRVFTSYVDNNIVKC